MSLILKIRTPHQKSSSDITVPYKMGEKNKTKRFDVLLENEQEERVLLSDASRMHLNIELQGKLRKIIETANQGKGKDVFEEIEELSFTLKREVKENGTTKKYHQVTDLTYCKADKQRHFEGNVLEITTKKLKHLCKPDQIRKELNHPNVETKKKASGVKAKATLPKIRPRSHQVKESKADESSEEGSKKTVETERTYLKTITRDFSENLKEQRNELEAVKPELEEAIATEEKKLAKYEQVIRDLIKGKSSNKKKSSTPDKEYYAKLERAIERYYAIIEETTSLKYSLKIEQEYLNELVQEVNIFAGKKSSNKKLREKCAKLTDEEKLERAKTLQKLIKRQAITIKKTETQLEETEAALEKFKENEKSITKIRKILHRRQENIFRLNEVNKQLVEIDEHLASLPVTKMDALNNKYTELKRTEKQLTKEIKDPKAQKIGRAHLTEQKKEELKQVATQIETLEEKIGQIESSLGSKEELEAEAKKLQTELKDPKYKEIEHYFLGEKKTTRLAQIKKELNLRAKKEPEIKKPSSARKTLATTEESESSSSSEVTVLSTSSESSTTKETERKGRKKR